MTSILVPPEDQWIDGNGAPLAGGSIFTYIPLTLTLKTTWQDKAKTVPNTNPVVLDADGRALIYGDGIYRFVVKDVNSNTVYDEVTEAYLGDSSISSAMLPVTEAVTLATARTLMGIDTAIQSAISGVATLTGPTGPTGSVGPTGTPGATGGAASSYMPILSGANPGYAKFPNPNGDAAQNIFLQFGTSFTSSGGSVTVSFPLSFPNAVLSVVATATTTSWWANVTSQNTSNFTVTTSSPLHGGGYVGGPIGVNWIAIGY